MQIQIDPAQRRTGFAWRWSGLIGIAVLSASLVLLLQAGNSEAANPVLLGTTQSFAVLAGTGITNTGPTTITGDIGSSPTHSETGFGSITIVNGTNHNDPDPNDAVTQQAKVDLVTAYNDAAGRTPDAVAPGDIGGLTFTPGVYRSGSSIGLTGTVTLDAQGDPNAVFVFQAGSTLITASGSRVKLVNGAQACNVFWQVGSSATLGTTTALAGNILALTSITINNGVTLNGRALARNGAVTMINDTITAPHCAGELDVARALPAAAGAGANLGVQPNEAVEEALVAAGVDPTRSSWTRSSWTRSSWTRSSWTRSSWTRSSWTATEPGIAAPWAGATWTCTECTSGDTGVAPSSFTASVSSWRPGSWSSHLQP